MNEIGNEELIFSRTAAASLRNEEGKEEEEEDCGEGRISRKRL